MLSTYYFNNIFILQYVPIMKHMSFDASWLILSTDVSPAKMNQTDTLLSLTNIVATIEQRRICDFYLILLILNINTTMNY